MIFIFSSHFIDIEKLECLLYFSDDFYGLKIPLERKHVDLEKSGKVF